VRDRHTVSDPESEVQVGEAVAASDSERADSGSGDDALVFLGELEHSRTQRLSLSDGEQQLRDPSSAESPASLFTVGRGREMRAFGALRYRPGDWRGLRAVLQRADSWDTLDLGESAVFRLGRRKLMVYAGLGT
jgi:hypothetical protein